MRVVFSARRGWCSWTRKIWRLCVSWFNCHVAYLYKKRFMNNKCTSIKSKIRFSSAAILPAISSPLFFPIAFIFKMWGFIFRLQNHHTQECKSGVSWQTIFLFLLQPLQVVLSRYVSEWFWEIISLLTVCSIPSTRTHFSVVTDKMFVCKKVLHQMLKTHWIIVVSCSWD